MDNKVYRKEIIDRVFSVSRSEGLRDSLETIKTFERRGGYFALTEQEQIMYSVCQDYILTYETLKAEAGLWLWHPKRKNMKYAYEVSIGLRIENGTHWPIYAVAYGSGTSWVSGKLCKGTMTSVVPHKRKYEAIAAAKELEA